MIVRRIDGFVPPGRIRLQLEEDQKWGVESLTEVVAGTLREWMRELSRLPAEALAFDLIRYKARYVFLTVTEVDDDR